MTDLTDKWKKGELPEGWYWVDYYSVDGAVMLEYIPQHNGFGYEEKELVQAVLAEVPDYIEWRNMVNCACEEHEANKRLIEQNAQLKSKLQLKETAYDFDTARMEEENAQLKELIKSALSWLPDSSKLRGGRYAQIQNLKRKINEALKC